jgi:hypothetical protein
MDVFVVHLIFDLIDYWELAEAQVIFVSVEVLA